jgi:hypothetical protein
MIQQQVLPFADLFKKYRLRAEFATHSSFAEALAKKGFFYDHSIFSHWQKGSRVPTNRELVLTITTVFVEKGSIRNKHEANEFLASTGLGYLTENESRRLFGI